MTHTAAPVRIRHEALAMDLRRMAAEVGSPSPAHDRAMRRAIVKYNRDARLAGEVGPRLP